MRRIAALIASLICAGSLFELSAEAALPQAVAPTQAQFVSSGLENLLSIGKAGAHEADGLYVANHLAGSAGACSRAWTIVLAGADTEVDVLGPIVNAFHRSLSAAPEVDSVSVQACVYVDEHSSDLARRVKASLACDRQSWDGTQVLLIGAHAVATERVKMLPVYAQQDENSTSSQPGAATESARPARSTSIASRATSLGYLPAGTILVNTEHVLPGGGGWISPEYAQMLRAFRVWDLSSISARRLARWHGVQARVVPLGLAGDALRVGLEGPGVPPSMRSHTGPAGSASGGDEEQPSDEWLVDGEWPSESSAAGGEDRQLRARQEPLLGLVGEQGDDPQGTAADSQGALSAWLTMRHRAATREQEGIRRSVRGTGPKGVGRHPPRGVDPVWAVQLGGGDLARHTESVALAELGQAVAGSEGSTRALSLKLGHAGALPPKAGGGEEEQDPSGPAPGAKFAGDSESGGLSGASDQAGALVRAGRVRRVYSRGARHTDIDVLFFGALTPHRRRLTGQLQRRIKGLRLVAAESLFGERLARAVRRSRIVLVPQTWSSVACVKAGGSGGSGSPGNATAWPGSVGSWLQHESKASRIVPLLADGAFVLAEAPSLEAALDESFGEALTEAVADQGQKGAKKFPKLGLKWVGAGAVRDDQNKKNKKKNGGSKALVMLQCNGTASDAGQTSGALQGEGAEPGGDATELPLWLHESGAVSDETQRGSSSGWDSSSTADLGEDRAWVRAGAVAWASAPSMAEAVAHFLERPELRRLVASRGWAWARSARASMLPGVRAAIEGERRDMGCLD